MQKGGIYIILIVNLTNQLTNQFTMFQHLEQINLEYIIVNHFVYIKAYINIANLRLLRVKI